MSLSRAQLKIIFETGDLLSEDTFYKLIDATHNLNDDVTQNYATFNDLGATAPDYVEGRFFYANGSFNIYVDEPDVTLQVGEEQWVKVRNISGSTIEDGQVIYIDGAQGQRPTIQLASNASHDTSHVVGFATHSIEHNSFGYVTIQGIVNGINTSSFSDGDDIYLGATAGSFTNIKPLAPDHKVNLGVVVVASNNGSILVELRDAVDINDLTEVFITNPQNRDRLAYHSETNRWVNSKPQDLTFITVGATGATSVNLLNESERVFVENSVPFTVYGATAPSINTIYEIIDSNGNASTQNITFDGNGKTIRGVSTSVLSTNWDVLKVVYNGTEYNIL